MPPGSDLAVVIPARNEYDRIRATVQAAARIPGVDIVVVVDDGSADGTAAAAAAAGAIVTRHARRRGKAAALETGAEAVRVIEAERASSRRGNGQASASARSVAPEARTNSVVSAARTNSVVPEARTDNPAQRRGPRHLLFLDADLAETAERAWPLAQPVLAGRADMTIAVFAERVRHGGHGLVLGLAGAGTERITGWRPAEPLNGQRCLTRAAFEAARPLAPGWGAETGMTIDLLRKGMRIVEVTVPLAHRPTGRDMGSQLHRAHQLVDVARALANRRPWQPAGRPVGQAGPAR